MTCERGDIELVLLDDVLWSFRRPPDPQRRVTLVTSLALKPLLEHEAGREDRLVGTERLAQRKKGMGRVSTQCV